MDLRIDIITNLKTKELQDMVRKAAEEGLKNAVVDITNDVVKGSPVLTGNNRRSIQFEIKGLDGSIYSTSGYGGFLETGTVRMPARSYFRPALDRNINKLPEGIKAHLS